MSFKGVFLSQLTNTTRIENIRKDIPKHFIYTRADKNNDIIFVAVQKQEKYSNESIPESMFDKIIELYVNQ